MTARDARVAGMAALLPLLGLLVAPSSTLAQPREALRQERGLPANVERVDSLGGITEYRLRSNGMNVLLVPNRSVPVITFLVVYHVGSRNEWPGATGSAHLLEHLLFNKSTKNFGKANGKKTFQEVLYEAGADFGSSNMTTWNDRMTGYSTLPSDKLEVAMRIEADRLGRALLLDSERQPEMSVVRNEYEIGENSPYGALDKAVVSASVTAHPYHWDTIGYRSDIEGVSTETLREHYRRFFHPDNATAVIVGDFGNAAALRLFDREFGSFPHSKEPIPRVITVEPPQEGERRVVVRRPGTFGVVQIAYLRPGSLHPDFLPLELLQVILASGVNSRLYQGLVEKQLATDVDAWNYTFVDPYPFSVQATVAPTSTHGAVEAALKGVLAAVARDGVSAEELARAKKQLEVATVRRRDGTYELASSLGEAVASANWKWFVGYVDGLQKVTAGDVKRVAALYFQPDKATVGWYLPRQDEASAPPAKSAPKAASKAKSKKAGAGGATEPTAATSFGARTVREELSNGLVVQVLANHTLPTVAVQGIALSGRIHAPAGQPALPALVAKMLTRGAAGHDKRETAARLDDAGARLGIFPDLQETSLVGSGMARDLRLVLETLADDLLRPDFASEEVAKAKEELRAEVLKGDDDTRQRAADRLSRIIYPPGHPYAAPTREAMLASVDAATVASLRAYHGQRFVGSGTVISIVGDVDPRETISLVASLFGHMPRGQKPAPAPARTEVGNPREVVETLPGKANTDFYIGHASGLSRRDPDFEAALIANAALGQSGLTSRIGKRVRDTEGLSYNIVSRFYWTDEIDGAWAVICAVAPQNAAKAIASSRDVVAHYVRDGITPEEVETQKSFFAGNFQVRLGTNAGVATQLTYAEKYGFGPSYLDDYPARFRAVTRDEVNAAIRKHIHPDRATLVVAGDLKEVPK